MLFKHHGIGHGFSGDYNEYYNDQLDVDSVVYFMLANKIIKELFPNVICIAEGFFNNKKMSLGYRHYVSLLVLAEWALIIG